MASIQQTLTAGTDKSGAVTLGGTAQTLAAAYLWRKFLRGQNTSSGDLWVNESGGTAAVAGAGSFKVPPGAFFEVSTNRAISVIGAITGQTWAATEG